MLQAGVIPSHRNSASTYKGGGITKQGSVWLRNAIVEAATTAARYDGRMNGIYEKIKKRRGAKKARIAVARHLLEINGTCSQTTKSTGCRTAR